MQVPRTICWHFCAYRPSVRVLTSERKGDMRRRFKLLALVPLMAGGLSLATATAASAAPSDNASCVAQFVLGAAGPPGVFQSQFHVPVFGQNVSFIAHIPAEQCPL